MAHSRYSYPGRDSHDNNKTRSSRRSTSRNDINIYSATNVFAQALRPFSEKVRDLPAGWLIPIAILFVISFPPLFGHEIIALLCGVVYGLWIGFAIVAAGTFIGESKLSQAFQLSLQRSAY